MQIKLSEKSHPQIKEWEVCDNATSLILRTRTVNYQTKAAATFCNQLIVCINTILGGSAASL